VFPCLSIMLGLRLLLGIGINAATQVYDLKNDWSDTQNPNGAWSYRLNGADLLTADPFPWAVEALSGEPDGLTRTTEDAIVPGYLELGDIYILGGAHSAWGGGVTARWTAPSSGEITLTGSAWSAWGDRLYYWTLTHNGGTRARVTISVVRETYRRTSRRVAEGLPRCRTL
jgi:hypothetical protein